MCDKLKSPFFESLWRLFGAFDSNRRSANIDEFALASRNGTSRLTIDDRRGAAGRTEEVPIIHSQPTGYREFYR